MNEDNRPHILGIPFNVITQDDAVARIAESIRQGSFCHVVTPGPEFIMRAQHDTRFRDTLRSAELSLADGMGVVLMGKILGLPRLERITGNDIMHALFRKAESEGWGIYLYGVLRHGAVERAAARAVERYPKLKIAGVDSGFRHWIRIPSALACWRIRRSRARILFVALGAPEQEYWIARNRHRLGDVTVAVGVGGAVDYLAGAMRRPPAVIRTLGFEWLFRLLVQPRRRWRRIVTAVISFPLAVMNEKLRGNTHG